MLAGREKKSSPFLLRDNRGLRGPRRDVVLPLSFGRVRSQHNSRVANRSFRKETKKKSAGSEESNNAQALIRCVDGKMGT